MEVVLFSNPRRPGFGQKPRREAQRPLLPQHARHCPVLEAGSSAGFLCYPSLAEHELVQVTYEGEGKFELQYCVNPNKQKWEPLFTITYQMAVGGLGVRTENVKLHIPATPGSTETALMMARMFVAVDDFGTPAGAVTLRGSYNFQTPPGWDTVYTSIFNQIERPSAPVLVIRVETDWHVHDTEFRYILLPGETMSISHNMPIGQVLFIPREEITFRDGTEAEIAGRHERSKEFYEKKAATKMKTGYGLEYSPHYQRTSREQNKKPE